MLNWSLIILQIPDSVGRRKLVQISLYLPSTPQKWKTSDRGPIFQILCLPYISTHPPYISTHLPLPANKNNEANLVTRTRSSWTPALGFSATEDLCCQKSEIYFMKNSISISLYSILSTLKLQHVEGGWMPCRHRSSFDASVSGERWGISECLLRIANIINSLSPF